MATMIDLLKRSLAINFVSFDLFFSLATGHRIAMLLVWPTSIKTDTHPPRERNACAIRRYIDGPTLMESRSQYSIVLISGQRRQLGGFRGTRGWWCAVEGQRRGGVQPASQGCPGCGRACRKQRRNDCPARRWLYVEAKCGSHGSSAASWFRLLGPRDKDLFGGSPATD